MAYCGARTSRGGYCRNPAGACPHHGASAMWARPRPTLPTVPSAARTSTGGPAVGTAGAFESRVSRQFGANAGGAAVWLLLGWLAATFLPLKGGWALFVAALAVLVPAGLASDYWARCGAWNTTGPRQRCRQRRRGFLVRCYHHHGVTLYDLLGLLWAGATALSIALIVLPALQAMD